MISRHLTMISLLVAAALVIEVTGSVCVVTGYQPRMAAFVVCQNITNAAIRGWYPVTTQTEPVTSITSAAATSNEIIVKCLLIIYATFAGTPRYPPNSSG